MGCLLAYHSALVLRGSSPCFLKSCCYCCCCSGPVAATVCASSWDPGRRLSRERLTAAAIRQLWSAASVQRTPLLSEGMSSWGTLKGGVLK